MTGALLALRRHGQFLWSTVVMASSLSVPWIRPYVIELAQKVGGDLTKVEAHKKGKKVQLVQVSAMNAPLHHLIYVSLFLCP